ncbi:MAG: trehalose-phosphatase [Phycisphaerae bacterium]
MSGTPGGSSPIDATLVARLDAAAGTARLLVASDFDGTIAPIVADPEAAQADRGALAALRALVALPATSVAILSGRSLADLAARTAELDGALRVGSHGAEFERAAVAPLNAEQSALRARIAERLRAVAARGARLVLEEKPASLALHYRNAADDVAAAAVAAVLSGPATWPGVVARHGKKVVELSVVAENKGTALRRIRDDAAATAAVFLGDDVTDEDAFEVLTSADVGVKVGGGCSRAGHRVTTTDDVVRVLARLAERRAALVAACSNER